MLYVVSHVNPFFPKKAIFPIFLPVAVFCRPACYPLVILLKLFELVKTFIGTEFAIVLYLKSGNDAVQFLKMFFREQVPNDAGSQHPQF